MATDVAQQTSNGQEDSKITVFNDKENFTFKHKLHGKWTLFYDGPASKRLSSQEWKDSLKKVGMFDTVEDFWALYNHIPKPNELVSGSNYHLFRDGIFPMWEDKSNKVGGKWVVALRHADPVEQHWLNTVLFMVGEVFKDPEEICGAVISIRAAKLRLSLWTKTALDKDTTVALGQAFKKALQIPDGKLIDYQSHDEALRRNSSYVNEHMYQV